MCSIEQNSCLLTLALSSNHLRSASRHLMPSLPNTLKSQCLRTLAFTEIVCTTWTLQVALFPFKVRPRPVRYPTTFTRSKIHKVLLIRCFCSCCLVLCGFALSQWKRCKAWGSIVGLSTTSRSYDLCLNTSMCFKFNSQWNKSVKGPDLFFLFCHLGLWWWVKFKTQGIVKSVYVHGPDVWCWCWFWVKGFIKLNTKSRWAHV